MELLQILLIAFGAFLVGYLFYFIFKITGPWGSFWTFVVVLILAGIATNNWVAPFGPIYWGISWVPTLFAILVFALLLAAATPSSKKHDVKSIKKKIEKDKATAITISSFFWVLIIILSIAALMGFID